MNRIWINRNVEKFALGFGCEFGLTETVRNFEFTFAFEVRLEGEIELRNGVNSDWVWGELGG